MKIKILKSELEYIVEKGDAFLVYTKSHKCWVCQTYEIDGDFIELVLK